jgi:hypothetical protein
MRIDQPDGSAPQLISRQLAEQLSVDNVIELSNGHQPPPQPPPMAPPRSRDDFQVIAVQCLQHGSPQYAIAAALIAIAEHLEQLTRQHADVHEWQPPPAPHEEARRYQQRMAWIARQS